VRFEVLTAVTMKRPIFWDVTPYSLVGVYHVSEESIASNFKIEE
jgi:hypothetical protein